ncbi:hypothetical protein DFJ63DRAFT_316804 [Scheffersomyces coipomensis]|uniref:uncharacterized protein n=1 Tax=Scheffersomyces coipomensis TaxID=1788519 RepID=UPI00315D295F
MSSKEVVIIGGSFGAIAALKTLVKSKNNSKNIVLSITVISPSEFSLFNIGTPRVAIETDKIDKIFFDLKKALNKYIQNTPHSIKLIKGYVTDVNLDDRSVTISNNETIGYDNLIIASGTTTQHPAFKLDNERDSTYTRESIKSLNRDIKNANKIAIIGGGATGVELAGEIGTEYKDSKSITLFTGSSQPLPTLNKSQGDKASQKLKDLNVTVINNKKAKSFTPTSIQFNDGSTTSFDLVIPAFKLIPNSQFLKKYSQYLDNDGFIKTDDYLRLNNHHEVIAFGDVVAQGVKSLVDIIYGQVKNVGSTFDYEVYDNHSVTLQAYKKPGTVLVVPIGKTGGVGTAFGLTFPSFLVKFLKSNDYMIPKGGENLS